MPLNNFTITKNPFTGETLTDANCIYIDADCGDDNNAGTRNSPKRTFTPSTGNTYLLRGKLDDGFAVPGNNVSYTAIGDLNTILSGSLSSGGAGHTHRLCGLSGINMTWDSGAYGYIDRLFMNDCRADFLTVGSRYAMPSISGSLLVNYSGTLGRDYAAFRNNTILDLDPHPGEAGVAFASDCIICGSVNLTLPPENTTGHVVLKNCIIRHSAAWKWAGADIPVALPAGQWDTLPGSFVAAQLHDYADNVLTGAARTQLHLYADNLFGEGTFIYNDSGRDATDGTGASEIPRLFNAYDAYGNVTDYTLNRVNGNPALYASGTGGHVGCYRPNVPVGFDWANCREIDGDGAETGNSGDLLQENDGIFFNVDSAQDRNRVSTPVVSLPNGDGFTLFRGDFFPSFSGSFYLGPKQNLTPVTGALNSALVEPYDTPAAASAFPKFFAPINREVEIAYHVTADEAGGWAATTPVLFSELAALGVDTNKNLAEVGGMAVTNACDEWDELISLATVRASLPKIRHFKITLIGNRI